MDKETKSIYLLPKKHILVLKTGTTLEKMDEQKYLSQMGPESK